MKKVIKLPSRTKLTVLSRNIWTRILKHSIRLVKALLIFAIVNITFLTIGSSVLDRLAQTTHLIIEHTRPKCLDEEWVTYTNYYILIIALVNLAVLLIWYQNHRVIKRDAKYLRKILYSDNERLPAVDVDDLVKRITGLKIPDEDSTIYSETSTMILENVNSIVVFLNSNIQDGSILMVDAPWGAGKTTATLIAISQRQEEQNVIYRYIYESSFKYTGNTSDFGRDLISALCNTLSEFGLDIQNDFIGVMQNIDYDASKLLPSLLKSICHRSDNYLTTELLNKINSAYYRRLKMGSNSLEIVVILDDMDRLQGEDIIKALSTLSIIRRLAFVKIIVPVDSYAILQQLHDSCNVAHPDKFIMKYLSDQKAVKLKTNKEIVEQVALRKIKSLQNKPPINDTEFCAAWAAIIIKLVANRLRRFADGLQDFDMQWLGRDENTAYGSTTIKPSQLSELLRDSSNIMDRIIRNTTDSYGKKYKWPKDLYGDARNFEDIILKPQMRDGIPVLQNFTEIEYDELIGSWIFDFARRNWTQIDATLRDVLDLILANDFSNLNLNRAVQFKQVLRMLFPKSKGIIQGIK